MTNFKPSIVQIAEICARNGVSNFIISAGSRSAPLTLAFVRHPNLTCRTVVDERSAAFIALGLAQQLEKPVGLVCTSGTAVLNYAPAVAEAFYQQIPLLVFTADRPPEWIDQNDNQTIHQREVFRPHCRGSFELPVDTSHPDARWHSERIISEAIHLSLQPVAGPVHINVPLREPLYPDSEFNYHEDCKTIFPTPATRVLEDAVWSELMTVWQTASRRLILGGLNKPSPALADALTALQQDEQSVFIGDVTSNLHGVQKVFFSDFITGTDSESLLHELAPELLVSFGGPVVSKNLKSFLRRFKPQNHWHIQTDFRFIDTFQSLTRVVPVSPEYFFTNLAGLADLNKSDKKTQTTPNLNTFFGVWSKLDHRARQAFKTFLQHLPHCEFSVMNLLLRSLPSSSQVQLGNSFIVRLANFLGLEPTSKIRVNSNRGTSGIDGTLSTAVGAALATEDLTTAIIGDLAFFYDRNALWHRYLPSNLRIVVINNQGGGIFRILDGARDLPELAEHFEVEHGLTAKNTAQDHGLNYLACDSLATLERTLKEIFSPAEKPAILEILTDKKVNTDTFLQFKSMMKEFT
ncbi:MAG: 2-succinyl-5-enolpyruvyl-6-hydroxy-3-cyclohexene-1-carboxylic-acid synthase [bacterium]